MDEASLVGQRDFYDAVIRKFPIYFFVVTVSIDIMAEFSIYSCFQKDKSKNNGEYCKKLHCIDYGCP